MYRNVNRKRDNTPAFKAGGIFIIYILIELKINTNFYNLLKLKK